MRHQVTRRGLLQTIPSVATGVFAPFTLGQDPGEPFGLPPMPYAYDALEPHIDARNMEIPHSLHHAAYVNNLNGPVSGHPDLTARSPEELIRNLSAVPESIRTTVRNNGGGHVNHTLFWGMTTKGGDQPKGELAQGLQKRFGGFSGFQDQFAKAATGVFGSGWAWLITDGTGELQIETAPNQDNPVMKGSYPLPGLDVREHAYCLKYQNRRPEHTAAFCRVINWDYVADRYRSGR